MLSALIQNFDTVEKVIETSADSAGSALKENERYLDSIQGKIDQFNNAMQAMWSDTLDSDVVKGFVALGTELIKIIDKIGLLNSLLIALATYSMIKNKMGPIAFFGAISDMIRSLPSKVSGFISSLMGMTAATSAYTAETLAASVANGTLSAAEAASIASKNGLALVTTNLTAAEASEMLMKAGVAKADALAMVAKLGLTSSTQALSLADIQAAVSSGALTTAQGAQIASALGLTVANKGLTASLMALWTALWPILAVMAAVGVIWGVIKGVDALVTTTEEHIEKLNELKTELSDVRSDLESTNSELETTRERMAELLAMDSLSFTEEEELENLQKKNAALEREIQLIKDREKAKAKETNKQFVETMESDVNKKSEYRTDTSGTRKTKWYDWVFDFSNTYAPIEEEKTTEDYYIQEQIRKYQENQTSIAELEQALIDAGGETTKSGKKIKKKLDKLDKEQGDIEAYMYDKTSELSELSSDIDYDIADDDTKKWLDYIYNLEDKWAIASGSDNAKTNAINRIFDKDQNATISDSIDEYVEALRKGDTNAKSSIENIIKNNEALVEDLEASGLSADEAIDYFTSFASELEFATLEGKIKEVSRAATNFETLLKGDLFKVDGVDTGLVDLFDEEGKIIQTKLSQVFQGTSEQTRAEITRLLEGSYDMIADGLDDAEINYLMNRMGLSFSRAILEIEKTNLATKNIELFPGLEDEISGIIDTFSELTSAVGSVVDAMDTLDKARAEEAYSGSMSLETLEALMQSTDNYADLIEVDETGAIKLATNAQEVLVAQKLEAIKQNAALALEEAELAYQEALHTEQTYSQTGPAQEFMRGLWNEVGGAMAFVGSLWNDLISGNWDGAWDRAKAAQDASVTTKETEYANKAAEASAAVAEAAKNVENAEKMNKIAQGLTPENVKERYSSEEASGGADNLDEVKENALDEKMEQFQRDMDYWENRISANQARHEQLQNEIDLLEARGQKADASYYGEQMKLENERKWLLEQQRAEARKYLKEIEATAGEGSEQWWEIADVLNEIESEFDSVTASLVDLQDAIGEIDAYKFEEFHKRLDDITSKLETIRNLMAPDGEEDWFDDQGQWTEEGVAVLGSYIQELETYKQGLAEVTKQSEKYSLLPYAGNVEYYETLGIHSEQEYYDKMEELIEQQYSYAESISDTEQSVVDMYESNIDAVEEYTETLIDSYNDYIDSVKEALDAERDLYDFKKKVKNQTKEIAAIERRIASLSGSTNASDIAERRRLEADLYGAREELDDTYYDHAKTTQQEALDNEAAAYEETMTRFIDGLRISLDQAASNMDEFLMGVTSMVMYNADTVLTKYQETNMPLTDELTNPWIKAKEAVGTYSGDALALMNRWTEEGGFFAQFNTTGTKNLQSPWSAGSTAANIFKTSVDTVMKGVVSNISTNVKTASGELSKLYQQIITTEQKAASANVVADNPSPTPAFTPTPTLTPQLTPKPVVTLRKLMQTSSETILGSKSFVDSNTETINGVKYYKDSKTGYYYKISDLNSKRKYDGGRTTGWAIPKGTWFYTKNSSLPADKNIRYQLYAKGTTGTDRDEWAITDEPQFGDELTMYATPEGTLSFMRAGSTVIPADLTRELIDLPKVVDGLINRPKFDSGINMIANAINKPEIVIDVENFLKVDRVDKDTLPQLEAMMDKKIDTFAKQLNYSIKKFSR